MLIYLDDSGDPGFKIEKGSSKVFVIALVIFDDDLDAEETALKIKRLRRSFGKSDSFEFKFNKCSKKFRLRFLKTVASCKFRARAITILKDKIKKEELRKSKESFYNYALMLLLKHNRGTIKNVKLRLDGKGEREFRRRLTSYLRKETRKVGRKTIDNLRFRNSKNDVLIQLADMIAGSINRFFSKKKDAKIYLNAIKRRIEDIWIYDK